jgi:uncharacterized protein
MEDLEMWQYSLIALGAFFVGLGKGGLPGLGNLTVVFLATALPAKASVGILLPILISADLIAVLVYRRHVLWPYILKLSPSMLLGVLLGYWVFSRVDDCQIRSLIGLILLGITAVHFIRKWLRRHQSEQDQLVHHPVFITVTGAIGGFATLIANAAGPVAALYFMASGLPKYAYLGTAAWFFLLVNLLKLPLLIQLGVLDLSTLQFSASFMLFSVLGAMIAPLIVRYLNQRVFECLVWSFIIIGGIKLLIL